MPIEFSNYAETRNPVVNAVGLIIPLSQGGDAKSISEDLLNPNRGDWNGTTTFPSTGGRFTGGAPMRGDRWRLTSVLVVSGSVYDIGTIVEAAVNSAGSTTISDWIKYAVQP